MVELCKVDTGQLFQRGLKGLLPLVPLTREGNRRQAVEQVIEELLAPGVRKFRGFAVADVWSSRISAQEGKR